MGRGVSDIEQHTQGSLLACHNGKMRDPFAVTHLPVHWSEEAQGMAFLFLRGKKMSGKIAMPFRFSQAFRRRLPQTAPLLRQNPPMPV